MKTDFPDIAADLARLAIRDGLSLGGLRGGRAVDFSTLLACAATRFAPGRDYTERDVNEALKSWLQAGGVMLATDHVELRRWLVDMRLLERDGFGRRYRRVDAAAPAFAAILSALAGMDADRFVQEARAQDRAQREARRAAFASGRTGTP